MNGTRRRGRGSRVEGREARAVRSLRRARVTWGLVVLACAAAGLQAAPLEPFSGRAAIAEAVRVGLSADAAAHEDFHAPYRRLLGGPFLQSIEVVSEFRRAVLGAERARGLGETWDASTAERVLEPYRGLVTLIVRVRFNPQNTYREMPRLEAVIYQRGGGRVAPVNQQATPAHLSGPAPPGTPILEGTLESDFRVASLDPRGQYLVGLFLDGRELQRIPLDLGALR